MPAEWNQPTSELIFAAMAPAVKAGNQAKLLPALLGSADPENQDDRLRAVTASLALALQVVNIGVWQWDFTSNHLAWDARMYSIYGIPEGTLITPKLWKNAIHPDDMAQAGGIFTPTTQQGLCQRHRFRILNPAKGIRHLEAAEELVLDAQGVPIACVGIGQDVTEWFEMREALLARQSELEKESLTDALTGVGNRRGLDRSLANEVSRVHRYGGKLSFLIADMDNFKSLNDQFGHEAGDTALRTIAQTMASMVRETDTVARFGGDEFCIVMPSTGSSAAEVLAERIRRRLEQAREGPGGQRLTASFGIVQLRNGETVESLLYRADQALYQAKSSGKNRTVSSFSDAMRAVLDEHPAAKRFLEMDRVCGSGTEIDPTLRNL